MSSERNAAGLAVAEPPATLFEQSFWSIHRHTLIAAAAEDLLSDEARAVVGELMEPLGSPGLGGIAGWADHMKRRSPRPGDDPDTAAFLADERNRRNGPWHYVNLPAHAEEYSRSRYPEFTRDDDVVQMYAQAVRVFSQGSTRFTRVNALRLIVHLVGDLHQPIHVGCGYLDSNGTPPRLVLVPERARGLRGDQGGNALILPIGSRGVSLHSYWDGRLGGAEFPQDALHSVAEEGGAETAFAADPAARKTIQALAQAAREPGTAAGSAFDDPGEPDQWALPWAAASLAAARQAYHSLVITRAHPTEENSYEVEWEGREAYEARCGPIVQMRMREAARNLAALLERLLT